MSLLGGMKPMKSLLVLLACLSVAQCQTGNPRPRWERVFKGTQDYFPVLVFTSPTKLAISDMDPPAVGMKGDILLLDVETGTPVSRIASNVPGSLPAFESHPVVVPLKDGRFLVKTADLLRLFSPDGQELKRRALTTEAVAAKYNSEVVLRDRWDIAASSDGTTVLATRHQPNHSDAEEHWLSADTLEDTDVEHADSGLCCLSVSRNQVVYSASAPKLEPLWIRSRGATARPLCMKCFGREETFLGDEEVVFATWPKSTIVIASTTGQVKFRRSFGESDSSILEISVAAVPRRIAFLSGPEHLHTKAGSYQVGVFDFLKKQLLRKILLAVRAQRTGTLTTVAPPHIAISPDGKRLAILTDSTAQLYSIED
jgi:hypothetical protein